MQFIFCYLFNLLTESRVGRVERERENKTELFTNVYLCVFGVNIAQSQWTSMVFQSSMGKSAGLNA